MSDESLPELPPLPQIFDIPDEAIARWQAIPASATVLVPLQRYDLDALFHGLRQSALSQVALSASFQAFTHGQMDVAEKEFRKHQETVRNSLSNLNTFIAKVMMVVQSENTDG